MKHFTVDQGTEEWHKLRLGMPTASNFGKIITPATQKISTQAKDYMYRLAEEKLLGGRTSNFQTEAMLAGVEREPEAAAVYAMTSNDNVTPCGIFTDDAMRYGASPDRLVGDKGLLEIKCPCLAKHMVCFDSGMPAEHTAQVQGQLWVTEREWADFMSYSPIAPPFITRVYRDDKYIANMAAAINDFCDQLQELINKLTNQ